METLQTKFKGHSIGRMLSVQGIISVVFFSIVGILATLLIKCTLAIGILIAIQGEFQSSMNNSYNKSLSYLLDNESQKLDEAIVSAKYAAEDLLFFSKMPEFLENHNRKEFAEALYDIYPVGTYENRGYAQAAALGISAMLKVNGGAFDETVFATTLVHKDVITYISLLNNINNLDIPISEKEELVTKHFEDIQVSFAHFFECSSTVGEEGNDMMDKSMRLITIISALLLLTLLYYIRTMIVQPIRKVTEVLERLSLGDLDARLNVTGESEIAEMSRKLIKHQSNLKELAEVANNVSVGQMDKNCIERSDKDILAQSMNRIIHNFDVIIKQSKNIGEGNYDINLDKRSDHDELIISMNQMCEALSLAKKHNDQVSWLKTSQNELSEKIQGINKLTELTSDVITFVCKQINAQVGAFYSYDEEKKILNLNASYAFTSRKSMETSYELGERLVGQAGLEKEPIFLHNVPSDYVAVSSGLGEIAPRVIAVYPIVFENQLAGVIELGKLEEFTKIETEFLEKISEQVAVSMATVAANQRVRKLLEETQVQSEELQAQQEELRVVNEELEEQADGLKRSEQELKGQQEELRVVNEELEEKTHALEIKHQEIIHKNNNLELATEELNKKAEELELSGKYKSEFLANMSHELRTPLNSMLILSRDLATNSNNNLDEADLEAAQIIHNSGQELLNLINDILDLSKVEAGKMIVSNDSILSESLKKSMKSWFKRTCEEKGIEYNIDIDAQFPQRFISDNQKIQQVLRNLLSNAIKFTDEGSVTLKMFRVNDKQLGFSVKDTGIGISEDQQKIIFEAFQQADGSTSRKYGGTGLGLSISREMSKLIGGHIEVKSQPGQGSTFTLIMTPHDENDPTNEPINNESFIEKPSPSKLNISASTNIDASNKKELHLTIALLNLGETLSHEFSKLIEENQYTTFYASTVDNIIKQQASSTICGIIIDTKQDQYKEYIKQINNNQKLSRIPIHTISCDQKNKIDSAENIHRLISRVENQQGFTQKISELFNEQTKQPLLLIEDNKQLSDSMLLTIKRRGIEIVPAYDAESAIAMLKENDYSGIILDLGLPQMSGQEFIKHLEKNKLAIHTPLVVYTGHELSEQECDELEQRATAIIIKCEQSEDQLLDELSLFLNDVNTSDEELSTEADDHTSFTMDSNEVFVGKRVLIVDDDMRNVFALSRALKTKGIKIYKAANGKMALEELNKVPNIDLILMDIMMPEMDGFETMKAIRKQDKWKNTPIITLTAKAMKEDREKCIESGASDYLSKPLDINKVITLMRIWLQKI